MWRTTQNLEYILDPDECETVLVLGAGASAHLGFPLGPDIRNNIINNTSDPGSNSYTQLLEMGFSRKEIQTFYERLSKSYRHSIDEFLSEWSDFIDIGRAAIAQDIISHEDEKALQNLENNWYTLLGNRVEANIKANKYSPVIATFNYDLSLDKFLYDFITSNCPKCASKDSLEGIVRVLHVHGCLGEVNRDTLRSYGQPQRACPSYILAASGGIRVPSELADKYGDDMMIARDAIKQAKRVIFLGFGYDQTNLARLDVDNLRSGTKWPAHAKYFGTAYKLEKARIQKLEYRSEKRLSLGNRYQTTFEYLSEYNYL